VESWVQELLEKAISRDGFRVHDVFEDGDCQFHAWEASCKAQGLGTRSATLLRKLAAEYARHKQASRFAGSKRSKPTGPPPLGGPPLRASA
jgi:hypothetical protein